LKGKARNATFKGNFAVSQGHFAKELLWFVVVTMLEFSERYHKLNSVVWSARSGSVTIVILVLFPLACSSICLLRPHHDNDKLATDQFNNHIDWIGIDENNNLVNCVWNNNGHGTWTMGHEHFRVQFDANVLYQN
jgi:hypothetical protein